MVGHGGSSDGSYLADPTSPIPSHCASIVVTSTLRVNSLSSYWQGLSWQRMKLWQMAPGTYFVTGFTLWVIVCTLVSATLICIPWKSHTVSLSIHDIECVPGYKIAMGRLSTALVLLSWANNTSIVICKKEIFTHSCVIYNFIRILHGYGPCYLQWIALLIF